MASLRVLQVHRRAAARAAQRGFTMIELMVSIAIVAVLASMAAPSFKEVILSNKLASYANNFTASAQLARSEAIKRNATVLMCRSADGTACSGGGGWQQGWIVWRDANANGTVDTGELIQHQQALSSDYHFTGNAYSLDFLSNGGAQITGGASPPVTLTLCRAQPEAGRQERILRLSVTGRSSIEKQTTGVCP